MNTQENDRQAYAQEQFDLAFSFYEDGNIEGAHRHWNNIHRNDDPVRYVCVQLYQGQSFYQEGDVKQARQCWNNILDDDEQNTYTRAQSFLGHSFYQEGNIEQAQKHWRGVIWVKDSCKVYAHTQLSLGLSFRDKGDIEQARKYWRKVVQEDDAKIYAHAQLALSLSFHEDDNIEQTRKYLNNIKREDASDIHAFAQLYLGVFYCEQGELEQARESWKKILEEDKVYWEAQYSIGNSFYQEGNIEQARTYWSSLQANNDEIMYARAQYSLGVSYIEERNFEKVREFWNSFLTCKFISENEKANDFIIFYSMRKIVVFLLNNEAKIESIIKTDLLPIFEKLQNYVNGVQKKLCLTQQSFKDLDYQFAHYTSIDVAEKIIGNGSFHLGVANHMNDPTEGKILLSEYKLPLDYQDGLLAFLTSFTFNENSLNQFRLYGKKDKIDGSGVSLVIGKSFFCDGFDPETLSNMNIPSLFSDLYQINNELNKKTEKEYDNQQNKKELQNKLPLFRCIYMNPETDYINIAHRSKFSFFLDKKIKDPETAWDAYIVKINEITKKVKELLRKIKDTIEEIQNLIEQDGIIDQNEINEAVLAILLPIIYLTKHAAFEEEAECRILYVTSILDEIIQKDGDRVYVEYGIDLADQYQQDEQSQNYLERIYLGPKADPRAELNLKKCWIDKMREKGMANNEIKIPMMIKSDMPLA